MVSGKDILVHVKKRWQLLQLFEIALYSFSAAVLIYVFSRNLNWAIVVFLILFLILLLFRKTWMLSLEKVSAYIDQKLDVAEYSSGLLLAPAENLSGMALLQRQNIIKKLQPVVAGVIPKNHLKWASIAALLCVISGFAVHFFGLANLINPQNSDTPQNDVIIFKATDTLQSAVKSPILENQELTINYPNYTGKKSITVSSMEVKALEGSLLTWKLKFDIAVDSVFVETNTQRFPMNFDDGSYLSSMILKTSGFYNFRYIAVDGREYLSDLYGLEATSDSPPEISIEGIDQFTEYDFKSEKLVRFSTSLSDDYGIASAQIIATVSKGSGESVKFREEKFAFDDKVEVGQKKQKVSKTIDLNRLHLDPGDELYFYVEALDSRRPRPNSTKSETYFAVIKDTLTNQFAVAGTMGADLMPDYFRSQRQLIIDTEKLIAQRRTLSKKKFNFTSNELGFDQKALRLKYGQFMGDEADSGIQVTQTEEGESAIREENPLAEYTHHHDGDNEHHLVDHEEENGEEGKEDPLHDYLHNHDDPDESTLFTQSLKSKLRQAMAQMWDAELQLRLYTPKKSLPHQYKALKLIQEIKNSARIYVHRIGFDPPPIKEDKRLTGELGAIKTFQKKEDVGEPMAYENSRMAIEILEKLIATDNSRSISDKATFIDAGNELASKAIEEPGKFLKTLQGLKWLTEDINITKQKLIEIQQGVMLALPKIESNPSGDTQFQDEINKLFLEELQANER